MSPIRFIRPHYMTALPEAVNADRRSGPDPALVAGERDKVGVERVKDRPRTRVRGRQEDGDRRAQRAQLLLQGGWSCASVLGGYGRDQDELDPISPQSGQVAARQLLLGELVHTVPILQPVLQEACHVRGGGFVAVPAAGDQSRVVG